MSTHHHHALWRRILSVVLVFSLLIGAMPPTSTAEAVDHETPATATTAAPLPAPAQARVAAEIPIPTDAESTSYPADYAETLRAEYGARHTLGLGDEFDGTFSTPSSQTGTIPGPIAMSGTRAVTRTLVLPAGFIRDSLTVDVSITVYNLRTVEAKLALRPLGATEWSRSEVLLRNRGTGLEGAPVTTTVQTSP